MTQPSAPVVVYTKPNCQPCNGVKRWLTNAGAKFTSIDVTEDPEALQRLLDLGYSGTPVTFVHDETGALTDHFAGFAPSKLEQHFPKNK